MKKEKMNDKGFSLVELIIVIAIMAVLVVVLAPQYLKYVERSRNSTDLQNATEVVTACQIYAADPEAKTPFAANQTFDIVVSDSGATITGGNEDAAEAALTDASLDKASLKCKSKTKWITYTIKGSVDANGGMSFDYTSADKTGTNTEFKDAMAGKSKTTTENP